MRLNDALVDAENNASGTMEKAMQRLGSVALQDMPGPSNFVKTQSVMYDMDGVCIACLSMQ